MPRARRTKTGAKAKTGSDAAGDVDPSQVPRQGEAQATMASPFGFPPWYLDQRAQMATILWDRLNERYNLLKQRALNLHRDLGLMGSPESGQGHDRNWAYVDRKADAVVGSLDEFADLRRSARVSSAEHKERLADSVVQLLVFIEDSLSMALSTMYDIVGVEMPDDDGEDVDWKKQLDKLILR